MKCKQYIESCFSNKDITPEVKDHAKNCNNCKMINEDWQILKDIKPKSKKIPKELDLLILSEAKNFISTRYAIRKALFRWITITSTAACIMLTAWLCLDFIKSTAVNRTILISTTESAAQIPNESNAIESLADYSTPLKNFIKKKMINIDLKNSSHLFLTINQGDNTLITLIKILIENYSQIENAVIGYFKNFLPEENKTDE